MNDVAELTKNRKIYVDASAAITSLSLKRISWEAEGRRIDAAIVAATRDRDASLTAVRSIEEGEETAAAPAEGRTTLFANGKPYEPLPGNVLDDPAS